MKDSQWTIAIVVLAALVFIAVFVGQYLGPGPGTTSTPSGPTSTGPQLELELATKTMPTSRWRIGTDGKPVEGRVPLEMEEREKAHQDFYFLNHNPSALKVGPGSISCTCSDLTVFTVHGDGRKWLAGSTAALLATGPGWPMSAVALHGAALAALEQATERHTWTAVKGAEPVEVPSGTAGWVRLTWKAGRPGPQELGARLWMGTPDGKVATLSVGTYVFDPIRVQPDVDFGAVRDTDLEKGLTRHLMVWSSTQPAFGIEAAAASRGRSLGDAFVVGSPEPLSRAQRQRLQEMNNGPDSNVHGQGPVLSGYRVPLRLNAFGPDGKTPCELGPFERVVMITSPVLPHGESKTVLVRGRVRGLVEIGGEDRSGRVNLGAFPRQRGKRESVAITSHVDGLELKVDPARTAKYLTATIGKPEGEKGGRSWTLRVEAKPNEARGGFPRKGDPVYEDSAVYLVATQPGQPPRSVRVPVIGTAREQ